MSSSETFPGDVIASIEEFEAGQNTFDDGDKVRAAVIGRKEIDSKNRVASVTNPKRAVIAKTGDIVIGQVEAVMSSMMAVSIQYINGKPTKAGVECICGTRNLRKRTIALPHDIVVLKIIGHLNGTLHASISEKDLGVLFTRCRKCSGKVFQYRDAVKCTDCSWIDDRVLSSNFGNSDFFILESQK